MDQEKKKRTLKVPRIHRWENWGLSVDHIHIINQWSSQCSFLSEESAPISVGTLLPIFLNKCQFSKTHFSWHYANKGKETEWPSVQRAGSEACLGPHTPLGHVVVSQKRFERSRPLSIPISWVSPPLGHDWGWWLPTSLRSIDQSASPQDAGRFCCPRAAIRNSFPPQPCFLLREMLTFLDKMFWVSPSHEKQNHGHQAAETWGLERQFKCVGFDLWRHLNVFLLPGRLRSGWGHPGPL